MEVPGKLKRAQHQCKQHRRQDRRLDQRRPFRITPHRSDRSRPHNPLAFIGNSRHPAQQLSPRSRHRHGYPRGSGAGSGHVDVGLRRGQHAHRLAALADIRQLVERPLTGLIARHRAGGAACIGDNPSIVNTPRPGIDDVSGRVHLLGVAGAEGDGFGALEVALALVVAGPAVAGAEGDHRKQNRTCHVRGPL